MTRLRWHIAQGVGAVALVVAGVGAGVVWSERHGRAFPVGSGAAAARMTGAPVKGEGT